MANWTELYRRRRLWLAFVEILPDGRHLPVNAPAGFKPLPTKETWHQHDTPIEPGGLYAAVQYFYDVGKNENPYHVLHLKRLPDDRAYAELMDRNHFIHASKSDLSADKDPQFALMCYSVGVIDENQYAAALAQIKPPIKVTTTPHKKSTFVF